MTPDLVITDLMMPGMSGVEVCRAIRSRSSIPVWFYPFAITSAQKWRPSTPARRLRHQAFQHSGVAGTRARSPAPCPGTRRGGHREGDS